MLSGRRLGSGLRKSERSLRAYKLGDLQMCRTYSDCTGAAKVLLDANSVVTSVQECGNVLLA